MCGCVVVLLAVSVANARVFYWKALYWLRPSQREAALYHLAEMRSRWTVTEMRHGMRSQQPMSQVIAARGAARVGLRQGVELLVQLSEEDQLKISPRMHIEVVFGGRSRIEEYASTSEWWAAVWERLRYDPESGIWRIE